jgi:hypothetical protein
MPGLLSASLPDDRRPESGSMAVWNGTVQGMKCTETVTGHTGRTEDRSEGTQPGEGPERAGGVGSVSMREGSREAFQASGCVQITKQLRDLSRKSPPALNSRGCKVLVGF